MRDMKHVNAAMTSKGKFVSDDDFKKYVGSVSEIGTTLRFSRKKPCVGLQLPKQTVRTTQTR